MLKGKQRRAMRDTPAGANSALDCELRASFVGPKEYVTREAVELKALKEEVKTG